MAKLVAADGRINASSAVGATPAGLRDQPCAGLQSADGTTLTIHGTPNLSTSEP